MRIHLLFYGLTFLLLSSCKSYYQPQAGEKLYAVEINTKDIYNGSKKKEECYWFPRVYVNNKEVNPIYHNEYYDMYYLNRSQVSDSFLNAKMGHQFYRCPEGKIRIVFTSYLKAKIEQDYTIKSDTFIPIPTYNELESLDFLNTLKNDESFLICEREIVYQMVAREYFYYTKIYKKRGQLYYDYYPEGNAYKLKYVDSPKKIKHRKLNLKSQRLFSDFEASTIQCDYDHEKSSMIENYYTLKKGNDIYRLSFPGSDSCVNKLQEFLQSLL